MMLVSKPKVESEASELASDGKKLCVLLVKVYENNHRLKTTFESCPHSLIRILLKNWERQS